MTTILHLITGLETGGAERMLAGLAIGGDRERQRPVVVSMTDRGTVGPTLDAAGIEVHALGLRRGLPDPRGVVRIARLLRRLRPQIVQTWLYHADLFGLALGRFAPPHRLLWNIQCTESLGADRVRRLLAWSSRIPDAVVVNSLTGKRYHEALGYRPRRWEHIPNGCDTGAFCFDAAARQKLRATLGIDSQAIAIGLAARYHPMKDHANFLAAAAQLAASRPELVFVLAGTGIGWSNRPLAATIASHGLAERVRLLGECRDMVGFYSALDIATLSSAYGEGCPNVLVEAMSCGIPCAATDCGDAAELIGPAGPVAPPCNPQALAAAWERLIAAGVGGRRAIGATARARMVQHYDLGAIVTRYGALYSELAVS